MSSTDFERELVALEKRFWETMRNKDARAAAELSTDPCLVAGAQGVGEIPRAAFAPMFEQARFKLDRFDLDGVHARRLGGDVGVLVYRVREEVEVDGRGMTLEAADSSTWVREDGGWRCALHTESLAGDPYGRDRRRSGAADVVRRAFAAFEARDRATMESLLADDLTFSSPRDDRIDKRAYFERCWPNGDRLRDFDVERAIDDGDFVFVRYSARRVADGARFRNTELHRVSQGKIHEIEVYFGRDL